MAIALRGTATTGSTTITAPTGVASGDLLLVVAIAPSGTTITVPSGWTTLRNATTSNSSTLRMVVAYQVYSTGSTWTITGATYNVCCAWSGTDSTTPILTDAAPSAGGAVSTLATPTVNNTVSGSWRVACWGAAETVFSTMGAWSTFSPTDTRRGEQHNTQYAVALTDSNATISTGNTSVTGTTPASNSNFEAELAWIGIIQPVASTPVSSSDTGSAADAANVAPKDTDTAAAADTATVTASTAVSQTATAIDTASVRQVVTDTADAAESAGLAVQAAETATATDSAVVVVQSGGDTATATDTAVATSGTPDTDTGSGTDTARVSARATDTGVATDTAAVSATAPTSDTAAASDAATVAIDKPSGDTASSDETALVRVGIPTSDSAAAADTARITLPASDTATAKDTARVRHAGAAVPARVHLVKVLPRLPQWTGRVVY